LLSDTNTNVKESDPRVFSPQFALNAIIYMRSDTVFYFTAKQAKQLPLDEVDFLLQAPRSRSSDNVSAFRPGAPALTLSLAQSAAP